MSEKRVGPSAALGLFGNTATPSRGAQNNFSAKADSIGLGGPKTEETERHAPTAAQALAGSNHDVVANRHVIRMANMSAAEVLKAELAGLVPVKKSASSIQSTPTPAIAPKVVEAATVATPPPSMIATAEDEDSEVPGLRGTPPLAVSTDVIAQKIPLDGTDDTPMPDMSTQESPQGIKRRHEEVEAEDAVIDAEQSAVIEDDDDTAPAAEADANVSYSLKVNTDGSVEQEDSVK